MFAGPPLDLDDELDNSSVYVQGLTDNVTLEELTDFFKQCGIVKVNIKGIPKRFGATSNLEALMGETLASCSSPFPQVIYLSRDRFLLNMLKPSAVSRVSVSE